MARSATIRLTASDLRSQPHSTAANCRPVAFSAYSAASCGFLLAMACRMPRSASSAATATMAWSGGGGWEPDSRYTPDSIVLSRSQMTHLIIMRCCLPRVSWSFSRSPRPARPARAPRLAGPTRSGHPLFHRDVRRLETELPVQRPHAEVPRVNLPGELAQPGLVGRLQHGGQQQLAYQAAAGDVGNGQRPEVPVARAGQRVGPAGQPSPADRLLPPRLGGCHERDLPRLAQRTTDPPAVQPGVGDRLIAERHLRDLHLEVGDPIEIVGCR